MPWLPPQPWPPRPLGLRFGLCPGFGFALRGHPLRISPSLGGSLRFGYSLLLRVGFSPGFGCGLASAGFALLGNPLSLAAAAASSVPAWREAQRRPVAPQAQPLPFVSVRAAAFSRALRSAAATSSTYALREASLPLRPGDAPSSASARASASMSASCLAFGPRPLRRPVQLRGPGRSGAPLRPARPSPPALKLSLFFTVSWPRLRQRVHVGLARGLSLLLCGRACLAARAFSASAAAACAASALRLRSLRLSLRSDCLGVSARPGPRRPPRRRAPQRASASRLALAPVRFPPAQPAGGQLQPRRAPFAQLRLLLLLRLQHSRCFPDAL